MKQLGTVLGTLVLATSAACGTPMRDPGTGVDASSAIDTRHDTGTGIDGPSSDVSLVYAHSASTLYKVDTNTFMETVVGPFTGISGSVTDIAVDKTGAMVAITNSTLYAVNPASAAGTEIKTLNGAATNFTGLGYVPDPADPTMDLLVTANASGDVYKIDPATGASTKIGNYGKLNGKQIGSSGDIFGVRGDCAACGIFATVKLDNSTSDYLAKIDPTMGWTAQVRPQDTGFGNIYGVGFWAGSIFGFDDAGDVLQIDPTTGHGTPMTNNQVTWWGAGVTTNAPIIQ